MESASRLSVGRVRLTGNADVNEDDLSLSLASASAGTQSHRTEGTTGSIRDAVVPRPHNSSGLARRQCNSDLEDGGGPSRRFRKERGPNWSSQEVRALIEAKRKLHRLEQTNVDRRELMLPEASKWQRISNLVMEANVSTWPRDGVACKSKWNLLLPEYKKIADYFKRSGSDDASYWHLSFARRRQEGLPRSFPQDVFWTIHEWYGTCPGMLPAHGRDLLQPEDASLKSAATGSDDLVDVDGSEDGSQRPRQGAPSVELSDSMTPSTQSPRSAPSRTTGQGLPTTSTRSPRPVPDPALKRSLPPGVTAHVISSSDTAPTSAQERPASTGVRRKSLSGHNLIAEATKVTGNALTDQMRETVKVSRELEQSKLDQQLRQFQEHMEFQRDRDRCRQENAQVTQANARLAIVKQGDVVHALTTMTKVLSEAFLRRPAEGSLFTSIDDVVARGGHGNGEDSGDRRLPMQAPSTCRGAQEGPSNDWISVQDVDSA